LPNVTITNADRTTETRKLTGLADRYKLISEAALTKKGFAQAEAMGELLRSEFPKADGSEGDPIQHYYISELPRTKETLYAMYGLTPDDHVIGPKEGTVPGTSVTYSSLAVSTGYSPYERRDKESALTDYTGSERMSKQTWRQSSHSPSDPRGDL
jgi:broad specificity phosphatase PhoE